MRRIDTDPFQSVASVLSAVPLLSAFYFGQSLMRSEDHVRANVLGVFARKLFGEGDHADLAQAAAEHDVEPLIVRQGFRIAQIRQHAAADRHVAVAGGAVYLIDSSAVLYRG